jgi:hypothetical protein
VQDALSGANRGTVLQPYARDQYDPKPGRRAGPRDDRCMARDHELTIRSALAPADWEARLDGSDGAREQRALLVSWWEEQVEQMGADFLAAAPRVGASGHATTALQIAEDVAFLRSTTRRFATETDSAGIASAAVALGERLRRLKGAIAEHRASMDG